MLVLMLRLWNYLRGYVIILVEGVFLEKFINISMHRQIYLWNIQKKSRTSMTVNVSIKGFKMLRPVAKKARCKVKILDKSGLPFTLHRYKKRKAFVFGIAVFIILIYVMTSFIWAIEIKGNDRISTEIILETLKSNGIKPGILKYGINTDELSQKMMMQIDELGWIGIYVKGTKVKVEIAEQKDVPEVVPQNVPCDILATREGVIESVFVKEGQEAVKVGDTVVKDQLLISGTIKPKNPAAGEEDQTTGYRTVHAIGEVLARTWYEGSCVVDEVQVIKQRTGRSIRNWTISIFNKKIKLFNKNVKYEDYDKEQEIKQLNLGNDVVLPFQLIIDSYYENSVTENRISLDEAKKLASEKAYKEATEKIPLGATVVKKSVSFKEGNDGKIIANAVVECIENIGYTKEIGGQ